MNKKKRSIKKVVRRICRPLIPIYSLGLRYYGKKHKKWLVKRTYKYYTGKRLNLDEPKDLNEKINWLKFHEDPYKWALLADKLQVREYVKQCGYENILVPLYGFWDNAQAVINDLDNLPDEFVLKCNNGNGRVIIISNERGGKLAINRNELKQTLESWLSTKYAGIEGTEFHYSLIKNYIIAEKLLIDNSVKAFSQSLIDYKIWCFNGEPFGCFVCYDRDFKTKDKEAVFYDLNWIKRPEMFSGHVGLQSIPKPKNWEKMLKIAAALSKNHPQVRVDLYEISDKVYFGEMTMTAKGGYMTIYNQKALLDMGNEIELDYSLPENIFAQ